MIVSRKEIRDAMESAGVYGFPILADSAGAVTTVNWLRVSFTKHYRNKLSEVGLTEWRTDLWDCDNFTRAACLFADVLHARTPEAPQAGLAFGEFWYHDRDQGFHAINVAIVKEGGILIPAFFEPQRAAKGFDPIVSLTRKEIESCEVYRF